MNLTFELGKIENHDELKDNFLGVKGSTMIINDNGKIIGFCNYEIKDCVLYLNDLEILENLQRKGYGKKVLQELFNLLDIKSIRGQALETSVNFYSKLNAQIISSCVECSNKNKCKWYYSDFIYNKCEEYKDNLFIIYKGTI